MRKEMYMPPEYAKHDGTIIVWPVRPGSWGKDPSAARSEFAGVINALLPGEKVYVILQEDMDEADLHRYVIPHENLRILKISTSDSWARDISPIYLINDYGDRVGVNFTFNAWGGEYDGLYEDYEADDLFAKRFLEATGEKILDASPFVLEGGSIHSDGNALLSTRACLLSKGRNPKLSEDEIGQMLCKTLGLNKTIWISRGIYNDETNEHVDNMCAYVAENEVVLAWTDNEKDPQYELSHKAYEELISQNVKVNLLPIPDHSIHITDEDMLGYEFAPGEDEREVGERLAASYVNFYIGNEVVLVPNFGGENEKSDKRSVEILSNIFSRLNPKRRVIGLPARNILLGGGNIHCITMQIPARKES